jgi:hypothetical protein
MNGKSSTIQWNWFYTVIIGFVIDLGIVETLYGVLAQYGLHDFLR